MSSDTYTLSDIHISVKKYQKISVSQKKKTLKATRYNIICTQNFPQPFFIM